MRKHSAFTFAELMVSLTIISIIAALLYPAISQHTPNTNKPLFQSAYRTLIVTIAEILNTRISPELDTGATSGKTLCTNFCNKVNVINPDKSSCATLCTANQLTTTNGMRWHFANYDGNVFKISVDVNASNNDIASTNGGNVFAFNNKGVFSFSDANIITGGVYNKENLKSQDSFWITIDKFGKIVDMSIAGWTNLEDTPDTAD